MLLNQGNEILLKIDADPRVFGEYPEGIYLKHMDTDETGMKMCGKLPNLWETPDNEPAGPDLYDDDHKYKVIKVDYNNALIWLIQI